MQGSRVRSPRLHMAEDGKSFKNEGAILITMFGAFLKSGEITQLERKTGSADVECTGNCELPSASGG